MIRNMLKKLCESPRWRWLWAPMYGLTSRLTKCSILARSPALWMWYARHIKPPGYTWVLPSEETQLLIDSAGSCATAAFIAYFRKWNPDVKIAYSLEVPAVVIWCARRNVPVILLGREPFGVMESGTSRYSHLNPRNIMRTYSYYHYALFKYRKHFAYSDFHATKNSPADVIRDCNAIFGTSFRAGDNELPPDTYSEGSHPSVKPE